ncbi:MAG: Fur family transcriptional regulator [Gordonia sp. (in: high G+C Gram-positive bacteria)]|uniref:Fur family transcriptional regulator n=1 Tax=Gordonia sp. (in: high G+C Gram-positive bacteria) TaxID=84139 RepID=UPI003BB4978A
MATSSGDTATLIAAIRETGLRVTKPRLAVYAAVHAQPHTVTEDVLAAVRADLPDVSRQAVYDVLRALTGAGLVRRIQPSGHVARYETRIADNHHHLVCRGCGQIRDVDCAVGEAPCLQAEQTYGFAIDEAEVVYWGVCPECATRDSRPVSPQPHREDSPL